MQEICRKNGEDEFYSFFCIYLYSPRLGMKFMYVCMNMNILLFSIFLTVALNAADKLPSAPMDIGAGQHRIPDSVPAVPKNTPETHRVELPGRVLPVLVIPTLNLPRLSEIPPKPAGPLFSDESGSGDSSSGGLGYFGHGFRALAGEGESVHSHSASGEEGAPAEAKPAANKNKRRHSLSSSSDGRRRKKSKR